MRGLPPGAVQAARPRGRANAEVAWLDAIPAGPELRAVTLADTPGPGGRTRRLIVLDLGEFSRWHGKGEPE